MEKISATIITLNEEQNIERALKSLDFVDEIVVVDSFSADRTVEICKKHGAKVIEHEFLGYGAQKNLAASHCQHQWIFGLDADEEVSPELKESIIGILKKNPNDTHPLYEINRLNYFCKKPIKHGGWFPDYYARLYQKSKARWSEPHVHERLILNNPGQIGQLNGLLHHFSFPTIESQVRTNIKYAQKGAKDLLKRKSRRPYLVEVLTRPFWKFIECYIIKLGLLDGFEGLVIAINAAHSQFLKYTFAYRNEVGE